jgi:aspartate aminotransferase-like enzyme
LTFPATRPIDAAAYAEAERRLATLLDTDRDVLVIQGEAILLLEAAARGLGGPGVRALNLVSGPYGEVIGDWLAVGGASVQHLAVEFDRALDADEVAAALGREQFDIVSIVHAEAATGVVNPLEQIAAAAHAAGAIVLVDAVASVGAEPLPIDDWDLDLVMIGPQKTLAGPAGVSALIASDRGWAQIAANPSAPRASSLSLLDWKEQWIDAGRKRLYGYAYEYEMRALLDSLDALAGDIGLERVVDRHQRSSAAARAGARALGLEPWVASDRDAASVVTLVRPPEGVSVPALLDATRRYLDGGDLRLLGPAPGPLADAAIRINHTGEGAHPEPVLAALTALAGGLRRLGYSPDLNAALAAADQALFAASPEDAAGRDSPSSPLNVSAS